MKTRKLHIKRAKPDNLSWGDLDFTDMWFSGWSELLDQEPPVEPILTPMSVLASESYTGEALFILWKVKLVEDTKEELRKIQSFLERIETFEYLQKVPDSFM